MKLVAIESKTGKTLLVQNGTQDQASFKRTVLNMFPALSETDIVVVCDGALRQQAGRRHTPSKKAQKAVLWKGSFTDLGGYANMNREICLRLGHHGWTVKADILRTGIQIDAGTHGQVKAMESTRVDPSCPMVVGFTPMPVQSRGRSVVFYTMMETQGLHPEFVQRCNSGATEVWVPCRFYEDVFKASGIVKPIRYMPLGVNQHIYKPGAVEPVLVYEDVLSGERTSQLPRATRFISLFGWSYRKGADVLCRSFMREFSGDDDAILVIYSRYMGSSAEMHKQHVRQEILSYYAMEKKERPARVFYCGDEIPIPDLPGCFAAADAFVFCSRGEGFALPVVEAAACGIPVISAYNTAMTEYLDDDTAFLVRSESTAAANDKLTWISEYYRDQLFAVLGDKETDEFCRHMRFVHRNKGIAVGMAEKLRRRIIDGYTWDACTERVAKRLTEIA